MQPLTTRWFAGIRGVAGDIFVNARAERPAGNQVLQATITVLLPPPPPRKSPIYSHPGFQRGPAMIDCRADDFEYPLLNCGNASRPGNHPFTDIRNRTGAGSTTGRLAALMCSRLVSLSELTAPPSSSSACRSIRLGLITLGSRFLAHFASQIFGSTPLHCPQPDFLLSTLL